MSEKEVLFSKAFRGYNRRDVNEYIAAANRSFAEKESSFEEEKKQLADVAQERETELASVSERLQKAEEELSEKSSRLSDAEKELAETKAALELSERNVADEIKRLEEKLVSLQIAHDAELAKVREEYRCKTEESDAELERVREEYRLREETRYDDVARAAYKLRDRMAVSLRALIKNCLREVMHGVDEMRTDADHAGRNAEEHSRRMNAGIDKYEEQMKNEVRRIIDEFKNGDMIE